MLLDAHHRYTGGYRLVVERHEGDGADARWAGQLFRDGKPIGLARNAIEERGVEIEIADPAEHARFETHCKARQRESGVKAPIARADATFANELVACDRLFESLQGFAGEAVILAVPAGRFATAEFPTIQIVRLPDTPGNRAAAVRDNPGWSALNDELRAWSRAGERVQAAAQSPASPSTSAASSPSAAPSSARSRPVAGPSR